MTKRVLIVDDAVFMRMKLRDILEKMGMKLQKKLKMDKMLLTSIKPQNQI